MAYTYQHLPLYQLTVSRRADMTDKEWSKEVKTINGRNANLHYSHVSTYKCACKAKVGTR